MPSQIKEQIRNKGRHASRKRSLWHGDNLREMLRLLAAAGATPHQHKIPAACSFLAMLIRWPCLNCRDCSLVPKSQQLRREGSDF